MKIFGLDNLAELWRTIGEKFAPTEHGHSYAGSDSDGGAASTAARLAVARTIALTGDAQGDGQFDGSADVTIATVVGSITNIELEEMLQ